MASCFAANETAAKLYYFIVFGLSVVVTWLLRDYAEAGLKHIPQIKQCFTNQVALSKQWNTCLSRKCAGGQRLTVSRLVLHDC